jgi:hypothetical protein
VNSLKRAILVLSAAAFLCLHIHQSSAAVGVAAALPFLIWFAVKRPRLAEAREMGAPGKAFCALTAMGVCLWPIEGFEGWLRSITAFQRLQGFLGVEMGLLSRIAGIVFAVAGLLFVYRMVCLFYERFFVIAREIAGDFSREEGIVAVAAAVILAAAVVIVYTQTDAFASPVVTRDLIYSSDSGAIVHENAYLSLNAIENDFRSPLFALFAAPLMGLPYLLGCVLPIPNAIATVLVAVQAPLLVVSVCLLMKMVKGVHKAARILLPAAVLATHAALLFTVMAEQYSIALFYFSLCLYGLVENGRRNQLLVLGAAGTMIPGAALAFIPERVDKKPGEVLKDALRSGLWGLVLLCSFGCFSVLSRIPETVRNVGRFTGAGVTFQSKFIQFASFAGQVFAAPQAGGIAAADGYMKWRLTETGGVSVFGLVILALVLVSFVLNRRQTFAQISMGWVIVSFLLLCAVGWGTSENGLTLYTLYFGWAYAALLVYLVESLLKAVKLERFSWAVYALGAAAMLLYNLPRLREMVLFACTYYPV